MGVPDLSALSWQVVVAVLVLGAVGTGLAFVINLRNIRLGLYQKAQAVVLGVKNG